MPSNGQHAHDPLDQLN